MDKEYYASEKEIMSVLKRAYKKFLVNDAYLLQVEGNERAMTHKYAEYLQQEFPSWHVDCEYNRLGDDIKRVDLHNGDDRVIPDIIVHRRGTSNNLIVIEAKKLGRLTTQDEYKLKAYLEQRTFL
jgi:alpha-amylase/alpha-mannosidase (GH57 family)